MSYADSTFSEWAFSEDGFTPVDSSAFQAFLDEASAGRCWLLELDALTLVPTEDISAVFSSSAFGEVSFAQGGAVEPGIGVSTLRFSTHGYTTHPEDDPADTFYQGRINGNVVIDRQLAGRSGIGGLTALFAEVSLVNVDGGLDELQQDYSLEGRPARLYLGRPTDAYSEFGKVFDGTLASLTTSLTDVRASLSDGSTRLDRLVNENLYLGTGALEGGDDLVGKPKPRALGKTFNVPAPLVDPAKLIYQVNDGQITDVPGAYDRGVLLTKGSDYATEADLNATAPSAGGYRVYKAGGYFRIGSTPDGTVTCDVQGDAQTSYAVTTADIIKKVLKGSPGFTDSDFDSTAFAVLNGDAPATVGDWVGPDDPRTCLEVVDGLLAGIGAFGGFNRVGEFSAAVLEQAESVELATFTSIDIKNLQRLPLPSQVDPVAWKVSVGWQPLLLVQGDLADSVTAARRALLASKYRIAVDQDTTSKSRYLLAKEYGPVKALYADEADAITEASRLFDLWGTPRIMLQVTLPLGALTCDPGSIVELVYSRFGLSAGRRGRVIGQRIEGSKVELKVLI